MVKEFRDFIMKGNVLDLAVAVIIGAAFGAIIGSLVNDILMPIISVLTGGISFENLFFPIDGSSYATLAAAEEAGAAVVAYGRFIQAILNFLAIALTIFLLIRAYNNNFRAPEPEPEPEGPSQEDLLGEIRDLLAKGR